MNIVVSGPGGVGKGTVVSRLVERDDRIWLSRSWTTRARRPGEAPDAYVFVDRARFEERIAAGGFLEWIEFLDYLQGTPVPDPPPGRDVLFEIDVRGAAAIREHDPAALLVFVDAPTVADQERRLRARGDPPDRISARMDRGDREREVAAELGMEHLVNDDVERCVEDLARLIEQRRHVLRRDRSAPTTR